MPRLVIGMDAGASKTWALVGDIQGRVLGWGKGGPGDYHRRGLGLAGAVANYAAALRGALDEAGAQAASLVHAAFCLCGADFPPDYEKLRQGIAAKWPGLAFGVHNDLIAGLRAGTSRPWGAVLSCGTGTNAIGRSKEGAHVQVGGFGYRFGDFGGGDDLGNAAVRALFLAETGRGPATLLQSLILAALGQPDAAALQVAMLGGTLPAAAVSILAPVVFAAANRGDAVAQDLLVRMGTALGQTGGAALRAVQLHEEPGAELVLCGSVWKGENPLLIDACRLALHRTAPRAVLVRPRYEPVVGAYLLALEAAGGQVGPVELANLEASLSASLRIKTDTGVAHA